ncbi:hypothetical protein [Dongia sp.]|uniref:hypothetical protein n=1 Tax=Dongia sp. TaxID=1977262 RepID=UPI003750B68C
MKRSFWMVLSFVMLGLIVQVHPVAAQDPPNGFSKAFFEDIETPSEMTGLWNRAFDRCEAAAQQPVEDCILDRAAKIIGHGSLTGPRCAHVSYAIARHYCIVIGSIAADLIVKFELDSADGFIEAQGDRLELDPAGTQVWSYLNRKCPAPAAPAGCHFDEVSRRLDPGAKDIASCKSIVEAHGQVDCLIAHWFAAQVRSAETAEKVGISGDFFFHRGVKPAINDLARHAQANCARAGAASGSDCLVSSVAAVLPYGNEMMPYCRDIADDVDRYLCVLTGALATDLYARIGVGPAGTFLTQYGSDRERTIDRADAEVAVFLAEKCRKTTDGTRCGPQELARRLEVAPDALKQCDFLTEDRQSINCLMASHVVQTLQAADGQL